MSDATIELWRYVDSQFVFAAHVAAYLTPLFKTLDAAQRSVDSDGAVILDRFSQKKPNPAMKAARDLRREILDFCERNLQRRERPGDPFWRW